MNKLEHYLDQVCRGLGGPRAMRQHIRAELRGHLLDAVAEHRAAGLSEADALDRALEDFGGPEQVRAELEATHGHRLLPVLIDKALAWKEKTLKTKWLWMTWTYLAVVFLVVLEVLFIGFAATFLFPKMWKLRADGWIRVDEMAGTLLERMFSFIRGVEWALTHLWWWLLLLATGWGLFEWRVRSENKPFMRLSFLGTLALALLVVVVLISLSVSIPPMAGLPSLAGITGPAMAQQTSSIDESVKAIDESAQKKDWPSVTLNAKRAGEGLDRLSVVVKSILDVSRARQPNLRQPTVEEMVKEVESAKGALGEAQQAARDKNADRLAESMKRFHRSYDPVRDWAAKLSR
jgi:hypothetical protein